MTKPKYNTQTPYLSSYVILMRDNKAAFVLRSNTAWMNGSYSLPSGKIENAENFTDGAIREGLEEAGVTIKREHLKAVHFMHRYNVGEPTHWVDVYFVAKQWEGEPYNAEPHMHGELVWFNLQSLSDRVLDNVHFALMQIEAGEMYSEYGWTS